MEELREGWGLTPLGCSHHLCDLEQLLSLSEPHFLICEVGKIIPTTRSVED